MTELFHFTCQHARDRLGARGTLLVPREIKNNHVGPQRLSGIYADLDDLIWLTDLEVPHRDGLGLRNHFIDCDRTEHRYRALDPSGIQRYIAVRRALNRTLVELLEAARGAMPMHWWVSTAPVPVELASIGAAA